MKGKKEIVILILVIAVLSAYLFVHKRGELHYVLPKLKKIENKDVTKMTIDRAGSEIVVEKKDDIWTLLPQNYRADSHLIEEMIDKIGGLQLTALASESKSYHVYELDEAHKLDAALYDGGQVIRKVSIGKTAPSRRHTFVMLEQDPRVYHAGGNLRSAFDKDVPALRDKTVMAVSEEITGITLKQGEKEIVLVKSSPPVSVEPAQDTGETEEDKNPAQEAPSYRWQTQNQETVIQDDAEEIIRTLSSLQCSGFLEEKKKEEMGAPAYTVTLKGMNTHSLYLYEKKDNAYIGTSSSSDYVFLIPEWKAQRIMKDPDALIKETPQ